ncbi:MAG: hypothetical protein ACQEXN_11980 [Actinomycetota bacterium]
MEQHVSVGLLMVKHAKKSPGLARLILSRMQLAASYGTINMMEGHWSGAQMQFRPMTVYGFVMTYPEFKPLYGSARKV